MQRVLGKVMAKFMTLVVFFFLNNDDAMEFGNTSTISCTPPELKLLTLSETNPLRVCSTSLFKTLWEKKKLLVTSNFSFSHSVFYPFVELFAIFVLLKIVICKLFQFGKV